MSRFQILYPFKEIHSTSAQKELLWSICQLLLHEEQFSLQNQTNICIFYVACFHYKILAIILV